MQIFLPLTRNGLIMALQSCRFAVPEIEVVRAFEQWTLNSPWVASTYGGAGMHAEQVQALTLLVDPTCLSPEEFAEVDHLFLLDSQDLMWQRFLLDPDVLARQRIGPSAVCEDRSQLLPPVQARRPYLQAFSCLSSVFWSGVPTRDAYVEADGRAGCRAACRAAPTRTRTGGRSRRATTRSYVAARATSPSRSS